MLQPLMREEIEMKPEWKEAKRTNFIDEGVTVSFPADLPNIFSEKLPMPTELPDADDKPNRPVINLRLIEYDITSDDDELDKDKDRKKDKVKEKVDFGDKGFALKVFYLQTDLDNAGNADSLDLLYFDETKNKWVSCKKRHNLTLHSEPSGDWAGYGIAVIKKWKDPVMGWGT